MARKKWTPKEEITDSLLRFREKRKWQLAFRRYVIERNLSESYAPFFGLDIETYRKWIEVQFSDGISWDNFGDAWQFDHIVPVTYFDFENEDELRLCWSFINIRVEYIGRDKSQTNKIDVLVVKPYFETLFRNTGFPLCLAMIEKISRIENTCSFSDPTLEHFIIENKKRLEQLAGLSEQELSRLNKGMSLEDILLEQEILRKFG